MVVGSELLVGNPTEELLQWCENNLVVDNPEYATKVRMGFWVGNTPKLLHMFEKNGDHLWLPYGCLREILPFFDNKNVSNTFHRRKKVNFKGSVPLYDYQEEAVDALIDAYYGILQSPAGSGKTQMGIALASELERKTLWLTHTKDLLNQSKERAEQYFPAEDMGTITEGKVEIGKVMTFATVQTMSNLDLDLYRDEWDTVIVDECHRVAGTPTAVSMFSKVLNRLRARHKYGLSATVHRADGLIRCTYSLLGPVVYEVHAEAVADKVMTVHIRPRDTHIGLSEDMLNEDGTISYARMLTCLGECEERNEQILNDLIENRNESNLILSDRVGHLKRLYESLPPTLQLQGAVIDGKMVSKKAKAERLEAIEMMRTGEYKYLFASYALAKEGLDIPRLNRLYLTTPQKDYAVVTQAIGRVARTFEGKQDPVVYDYIDNITMLEKSYKKRCTTYRKQGCVIEERT